MSEAAAPDLGAGLLDPAPPDPAEPDISLQQVSRWYGQVIGLNDVTCRIGPGVTALLGPNGAGKSTFMKLVSGQLRPTTGEVRVLGLKPFASGAVYRRLGYCPESERLRGEMTGREFVAFLGVLAGLTGPDLEARVERVITQTGMQEHAGRRIGGYSKGMRQRIKLAQALLHDPQVLLLDEPLNGLDPVGRREISGLMRALGAQGRCVLVSSHILYEVEQVTHQILLIHRGRLLAQGDMFQIRSLIDRHPHRISLSAENPRALAAELVGLPGVETVRFDPRDAERVEVETRAADAFYNALPALAAPGRHRISEFHSLDNNLEAVFRYLTEP